MNFLKASWFFTIPLVVIFVVLCYLLSYLIEQDNRKFFNNGYFTAYSQYRQGILDSKVPIEIRQQFEMESVK
jgi:hypothetical protein